MSFETEMDNYTTSEKELFQRVCRRLLKTTFIVREKNEDNRNLYLFASKHETDINDYLKYIGFVVDIDRDNGVVMLANYGGLSGEGKIQSNRLRLDRASTVMLCNLWTAYMDRIRGGTLARSIVISMFDLRQELEKYGFKNEFDGKVLMSKVLKLLSGYNLVEVNGKVGDPECNIKIFPSVQFALDMARFQALIDETMNRIASGASENDDDEADYQNDILEEDSDYE